MTLTELQHELIIIRTQINAAYHLCQNESESERILGIVIPRIERVITDIKKWRQANDPN